MLKKAVARLSHKVHKLFYKPKLREIKILPLLIGMHSECVQEKYTFSHGISVVDLIHYSQAEM